MDAPAPQGLIYIPACASAYKSEINCCNCPASEVGFTTPADPSVKLLLKLLFTKSRRFVTAAFSLLPKFLGLPNTSNPS